MKKTYMPPKTIVFTMAMQQMIAFSGGDPYNQGNPSATGDPDDSPGSDTNRSRYNIWDDEDEY